MLVATKIEDSIYNGASTPEETRSYRLVSISENPMPQPLFSLASVVTRDRTVVQWMDIGAEDAIFKFRSESSFNEQLIAALKP